MAGISTTGMGSPAATSTFAPAASAVQPGPSVQGRGGSTTLPDAAPADFASDVPTPLDQPHATYPTLTQSHVAVLQAIGTPEAVISTLAQSQPQAGYLDRYIQGEIMQNPEGWDDYVGNRRGTARAGLQQLIPGVQLPPAGGGRPGYLPDGSPVSGIGVPGLSSPLLDPSTGAPAGDGGMVKLAVAGAAIVGVGLLAWKLFKGGGGGGDAAKQAAQAFAGGAGAQGGGVAGLDAIQHMGRQLVQSGVDAKDLGRVQRGFTLGVFGGGGATGGGAAAAATAESIMNGMGPANGFLNSVGLSSLHFNQPMNKMIDAALANNVIEVMRDATRTGQLGDFATSIGGMKQALAGGAEAAGGAATGNEAVRNLLASAANVIPV